MVQRARRWQGLALGVSLGTWIPGVAAADERLEPIEVRAERLEETVAPTEGLAVTVVRPAAVLRRVASVAELIEREAGVQIRSQGGLGAFTAVSIRGADPGEVAIFLDGVPINRASAAAVDLSRLPVEAIERVEIYRGVVPLELGGQAVGGAIYLVSRLGGRPGSSPRATVGGGALAAEGAREVSLGWGFHRGHPGKTGLGGDLSLAYQGASGDFLYLDKNTTLLDGDDDRELRRQNNDFDQLAASGSLRAQLGATRITASGQGFWKRQGVPGRALAGAASLLARLESGRGLLRTTIERSGLGGGLLDARCDLYGLYERASFDNPKGEGVGSFFPARSLTDSLAGGLSARVLAAISRFELWTFVAQVDVEHFRPRDLLRPEESPPPSTRLRFGLGVGDEIRLLGDRLSIQPGIRLDGVMNDLARGLGVRGRDAGGSTSAEPLFSPRLAVSARPWGPLLLHGSLGRFARLPTVVELFGDSAFVLPRPELRAETAVAGDLGARLAVSRPAVGASLEATGFARGVSDYIALVPSANALAAVNLPGAQQLFGLELSGRLRLGGWLDAALDYTLVESRNDTAGFVADSAGKRLPGVARHRASGRLELRRGPLAAYYDFIHTSATFRDAQNSDGNLIPGRTLHGAGVVFGPFPALPLRFAVDVRNLADQRTVELPLGGIIHGGRTVPYPLVDRFDYPLPGRALYATVTYRP